MSNDPGSRPLPVSRTNPVPRPQTGAMPTASSGPAGGESMPTPGSTPPPTPGPTPGPTAPRRDRSRTGLLAGAAAMALAFGGVGGFAGNHLANRTNSPTLTASGGDVEAIAAKALPSVVTIRISSSSGSPRGTGSGFVLRADGYIVTNNHVASAGGEGSTVKVLFPDETEADAKVVGVSPTYDLAVLKVERNGLTPLPLARSQDLRVGQPVMAVGAPLGLTGSVTTGIVSALNRPVVTGGESGGTSESGTQARSYMNAIQTDAAINQGNSGGPLLDLRGRVVGVNTAIYSSRSGGSIGLGFAIPADQVQRTTDQIIRTGKAEYPVIGVDFDPGYAGEGVRVSKVDADGPAGKAGVKEGDVITSIDGVATKDPKTFLVTLRSKEIGETITVGLGSGDQARSVTMRTAAGS